MTPALHLVDANGEVKETTPQSLEEEVQFLRDEVRGLQRDVRGWARRYAELQRDKDAEARAHQAFPEILKLFAYWQEQTGHKRAKWVEQRFWVALPLWQAWGTGNCAAAIAGIAHEPNKKVLNNGRTEVYDDWETVFKNSGNLRRYMGRRPKGWSLPPELQQ